MNSTTRDVLKLPMTTAECEEGPIVEARPGSLRVRYDAEGEDGPVWLTLAFEDALAYRFTPEVSVTELMVQAYSRVVEVLDSDWREHLESTAAAGGAKLPPALRHLAIYFDHAGCLEVLASSVGVV